MIKNLILFSLLGGIFLCAVNNVSAQTKKLLVFKKGVTTATGTIKGTETRTFYFKVKKDTDIEIEVEEAEPRAKFVLYKPNGKNFYDEPSTTEGDIFDMIDILPEVGNL